MDPVRRPQAGSVMAAVNEGLHRRRARTVAGPMVVGHPPQEHPRRLRRQAAVVHAGPDQETAHAGHRLKVALPHLPVPPDPAAACGEVRGGGGHADAVGDAVRGDGQAARLPADLDRGAPHAPSPTFGHSSRPPAH